MASFQQKLLLKGSEESIEYFTEILKRVKDKAGYNTATVIIESLQNWSESGSPAAECGAVARWDITINHVSLLSIIIHNLIFVLCSDKDFEGKIIQSTIHD